MLDVRNVIFQADKHMHSFVSVAFIRTKMLFVVRALGRRSGSMPFIVLGFYIFGNSKVQSSSGFLCLISYILFNKTRSVIFCAHQSIIC